MLTTASNGGYVQKASTSVAAAYVAGLAAKGWQGSTSATRRFLTTQAAAIPMNRVSQETPAYVAVAPGY